MNRRSFLSVCTGAAAGLALRGQTVGATDSASAGLVSVELEAAAASVTFAGRRASLYSYNNQVPGPAIQVRPGDTLRIDFKNSLPESTNLHFHGLHVSPGGNADNAFVMVDSGEQFRYELPIPANHLGGTFWVHPHMHGSAARQVWRGLAAPVLVRGELDAIPEIQSASEVVLVLQDISLTAGGQPIEPNFMQQMVGREGSLVAASGAANPSITIQKSGWVRLRLINASCSRFYRLQLEDHELFQVATDGGALPTPIALKELLLVPGQRAELMINGSRPPGTYRLLNLPYNRGGMSNGMGMMGAGMISSAAAPSTIASFVYSGEASQTILLPQKLVTVETLPLPSKIRTFVLVQSMGGGMMGGTMGFGINGQTFDPGRVDTRVQLGDVEEWEFINPMGMDHPMHIHTNPFQVIQVDGTPETAWRDTVLVPAGGRVRVRIAFRDFAGKLVYHCHILDHEDLGMMGILEIDG